MPHRRLPHLPLWALPLLAAACAGGPPAARTGTHRPAGCHVALYHEAAPGVRDWDDLGIAEVDCDLDLGAVQCLTKLRDEACRRGGDLLYDVPTKPLRPSERAMMYRGRVARRKAAPPSDGGADPDETDKNGKDQAPPEMSTGPIEPLIPPPPPPSPDAGAP